MLGTPAVTGKTDCLKRAKSTGWLYTIRKFKSGENSHPLGKTDWLTMLKNKTSEKFRLGRGSHMRMNKMA
jgi:hypothetical protein